jgi:DNA (cytosine-5)-methyltransferase 1
MEINQLDLFSGIGGFHLGFERAGFKVNSYFSEVDKHAIAVYKHQFKNSTYVGSVVNIRGNELPRIDLITFGSPCQDFSLAGKRKGMEGERSSLILEAIRLIHECRPRVFIWENVKGTFSSNDGADFAAILQEFANIGGYRLEWQLLNTSWFLPQNRERIYLVGHLAEARGDWRGVFPIGEGIGENYSGLKIYGDTNKGGQKGVIYNTEGISGCLSATDYKQPKQIAVKNATQKGYEVATVGDSINYSNPNSKTRRGRVGKKKAQTLETSCNQAVIEPMVQQGSMIKNPLKGKTDYGWHFEQNVFTEDSHTRALKSSEGSGNKPKVIQDYRIRRLTPIECERLQGFPDNHTQYGNYDGEVKEMSNTQRYKQCGNAVTVDVVQAIAEKLHPLFEK